MTKLHAGILLALAVVLAGALTTVAFAAQAHYAYRNVIVPHVSVANIDLSGLDELAATSTLQKAFDSMVGSGLNVTVGETTQNIPIFQASSSDTAYNLIEWDAAASAREAMQVGHSTNTFADSIFVLYYELFGKKSYAASVTVNNERLTEAVKTAFAKQEIPATPTAFTTTFARGKNPETVVTPGINGQTLDIDSLITSTAQDARDLVLKPVTLKTSIIEPDITAEQASSALPNAVAAIDAAPYTITGINTAGEPETWNISEKTIADWIMPKRANDDQTIIVGINAEKTVDLLTEIHSAVDVPAQNARFSIDGGKVTEFQGSTAGNVLDDDAFFTAFETALGSDTSSAPLAIVMHAEEPSVTTENVNSLGITEIIGQAMTSFPTSTANRKQNIKHGAEKLNGLLIAPGETISLLDHLRPFTIADGYVPELVIKGDEIKPEVGGGLCQIGTTTFRAAMNSGLEIVERRNHSLAVSYYNDATNGNPGTDATIYDPAPDFKFKNDMPTYLLLATAFDGDKKTVTFTFWGTKDGRQGSYTPPTVLTRTSPGPAVYTNTTALAPGKQECEGPFIGATTTFNYNIIQPDGTTKTQEFFSSYRPLAKSCLVGVDPATMPTDPIATDSTTTETPATP
jgi:vancomycin resistance protein YoaR